MAVSQQKLIRPGESSKFTSGNAILWIQSVKSNFQMRALPSLVKNSGMRHFLAHICQFHLFYVYLIISKQME